MRSRFFWRSGPIAAISSLFVAASLANADPVFEGAHGIAMYGEPALPPDFVSLPYANPDAPKGGQIVFGETGSFDSLNPFILKGRAPWGIRVHVFESLMGRNWDESFSLYGLLAESIRTNAERDEVSFTLRENARFSDGTPVTVEDVIWSFETLGRSGHPRYRTAWDKIDAIEKTGPRGLRITFNTADRELPLILGLRPILKKAQYESLDFAESGGIDALPVGTGPYKIAEFEVGRFIRFERDPNYWGRDLPFNAGQNNFDSIRYDYFGDGDVVFEAFKAGAISTYREPSAAKWDTNYNFPSVTAGDVVKSEIPHQRPSGIAGFVMNTRRPVFQDWQVREALITMFNFEFINTTLNGGYDPRITSYFSNSELAMRPGPAEGEVRELLAPFAATLPPGALEGYSLPETSGAERDRSALRTALALFADAGWTLQDGVMRDASGTPFTFEILLSQGATQTHAMIDIYARALTRVGIVPTISIVDSAQYRERTNRFDFGMTFMRRNLSLSPGNEQWLYWGSDAAAQEGSRNLMGVASPAVDAMITALLTSESRESFRASARALDRLLTAGRYVIPIWHSPVSRLAHVSELHYPSRIPIYGDWLGFQPEVWWWEEK